MLMNFLLIYIAILMMIFDGLAIVSIVQEAKELQAYEEAKAKLDAAKAAKAKAKAEKENK